MRVITKLLLLTAAILSVSCSNNDDENPPNTDKTYIVISDIHLGDSRSINDGYGWNLHMKDTLAAFLDYLAEDDDWDELVIAGDMIDEWIVPSSYLTYGDSQGNLLTEKQFFVAVVESNRTIFDKFYTLKNMGKKLVYVSGNHDMSVTKDDFEDALPGLFEFSNPENVTGLGSYNPETDIFIEHGHRYDITNAPYIGKVGVDDIPEGSILPPGFFVSKLNAGNTMKNMAATKGLEDATDDIIYNIYWDVMALLFGTDDVVTMADGMTEEYKYSEYAHNSCKLYKNIDIYDEPNDGWNARCKRNKARLVPTVTESIISCIFYDVFTKICTEILETDPTCPPILVMGHTHEPELVTARDGEAIYMNTGCWVDSNIAAGKENTSTFGKIKHTDEGYDVSVCRFDLDATGEPLITTLKAAAL